MVKVVAALSALLVLAMPAQPSAQEFDAVSIKRNPVVDRTGLNGPFALRLRLASNRSPETTQTDAPDAAPVLFTALQEQLGLKLEPGTVQGQVLVIDHIERPSEN